MRPRRSGGLKAQIAFLSFSLLIAALRNDSTVFASSYWFIGRLPKRKRRARKRSDDVSDRPEPECAIENPDVA
jgi:hypothetical protein